MTSDSSTRGTSSGSAICIGDEVLYTGDAAGRDRAFLGRCRTKKARVLITESTFGRSNYVFPPVSQIVKDVNSTIGMLFDKGRPVVLMGYALGKSQILSHLFASWSPFLRPREGGRDQRCLRAVRGEPQEGQGRRRRPRGPLPGAVGHGRADDELASKVAQRLKKEHGAALVAFSGWAADPGYAYSIGADYAFAVSDHCDYNELLGLVKESRRSRSTRRTGSRRNSRRISRKLGFDAKPLSGYQAFLSDY